MDDLNWNWLELFWEIENTKTSALLICSCTGKRRAGQHMLQSLLFRLRPQTPQGLNCDILVASSGNLRKGADRKRLFRDFVAREQCGIGK